jgi:hypothetical protein
VAGLVAAAVVVVIAGVWMLVGGGPDSRPVAQTGLVTESSEVELGTTAPATSSTTVSITTTPTTTTHPTTTATTSKARATMPAPTSHKVTVPVPPPPHPAPVPGCTPSHVGTPAPRAEVKAALLTAAGTQYWANAASPPRVAGDDPAVPGPKAVITVPPLLMQAIAWQESGWQSDIRACDGGVGTMQVMKDTASWMNQRFGTSYDHTTLAGNAAIGAQYLQWLVAYFGQNYFGNHFDITNDDLLNAVIAAYNVGPANVQFADGHTVVNRYATTVRALMTQQPWN